MPHGGHRVIKLQVQMRLQYVAAACSHVPGKASKSLMARKAAIDPPGHHRVDELHLREKQIDTGD